MRRGFKQWAEGKAVELRRDLGLDSTAPLRASALADHLDILILTPKEIPNVTPEILDQLLIRDKSSWSAMSFQVDGQVTVIHNPKHSLTRVESNLMHEIAHNVCNHQPSQLLTLPGTDFPLRSYDNDQEEEARWLGACLQIPRRGLLQCVYKGMDNGRIARHYYASISLVRFRRNVTGVDRQAKRSGVYRRTSKS